MKVDNIHPDSGRFGGWAWRDPHRGEHFRRCSFCGSIHPDDLFAEPIWLANWADRKYGWPHKFYVPIPNRDPDRLYVASSTTSPTPPTHSSGDWIAWNDLTPEQLAAARENGYADGRYMPTYLTFGTHTDHFGKFYTIHLADPDVAPAVKHDIERRSGIAFTFTGDRVHWAPATHIGADQ